MSDTTITIHWHTVWMTLAFIGTFALGFFCAVLWMMFGEAKAIGRIFGW